MPYCANCHVSCKIIHTCAICGKRLCGVCSIKSKLNGKRLCAHPFECIMINQIEYRKEKVTA